MGHTALPAMRIRTGVSRGRSCIAALRVVASFIREPLRDQLQNEDVSNVPHKTVHRVASDSFCV